MIQLKNLKSNKKSGILGVCNEIVKCIESPNLTEIIATVMEQIINYGIMPQIMNVALKRKFVGVDI